MGNFSLIEGPWDCYTFRKVQPQDWEKVIKHIKDFFLRDEPTSKLIGYTDDYGEEFAALARKLFLDNLSFWVEDNETGEDFSELKEDDGTPLFDPKDLNEEHYAAMLVKLL